MVTILNPKPLTTRQKFNIEKFSFNLKNGHEIFIRQEQIPNKFKYKAFLDETTNNVSITLNKFFIYPSQNDYQQMVKKLFLANLLTEVSKSYLRDEMSMVYNCGGLKVDTGVFNYNLGFSTNVGIDKLDLLLTNIKILLEDKILQFLKSADSDLWFTSEKSKFIFQTNKEINMKYAEDIGYCLLFGYAPDFQFTEMINFVKKLTKEELIKFYLEWLNIPTGVWFVSAEEPSKVEEIFEKSKLFEFLNKEK